MHRSAGELEALGLQNQQLVVNAVFEASDRADHVALALEQRGREALGEMPARLKGLPTLQIPLRAFNMVGIPALRALLDDRAAAQLNRSAPSGARPPVPGLASLMNDIAAPGRGLIMVMGKGGVGKTTIAAAVAAELASRGHSVHISTTDPAAHITTTLAGQLDNLTTSRIDPVAETKAYVDRVMTTPGAGLDEAGRALLAKDLRSLVTRRWPSSGPSPASSARLGRASWCWTPLRPGTRFVASAVGGCPFCIDMNAAAWRDAGLSASELEGLGRAPPRGWYAFEITSRRPHNQCFTRRMRQAHIDYRG